MNRPVRLLLALVVSGVFAASTGVAGVVLASPATSTTASTQPTQPPGDTIVEITGDAANGFAIHHYDGSALFPPTDSEARAECAEYDTRVARVRCRTEVRTWYRDLAATQQALEWAHRA